MAYANNTAKFVAVLNRNVSIPQLLNALGHATAGLAAELGTSRVRYLDYRNDADGVFSKIAEAPFIILKARSRTQLSTLTAAAKNAAVAHNVFLSTMIGSSAAEQIEQTQVGSSDAIDYWVVVLFGEASVLNPLTRKFSLFNIGADTQGEQT